MTALTLDQLVRKEVALGAARELPLDRNYIWPQLAPWMSVNSDDVVFRYIKEQHEGMVPPRAEDAEAEMAQKDSFFGTGRASLMDWAIKDRYSASDVTRYREFLRLAEMSQGQSFPLTIGSATEDFANMVAADAVERRRKIERRLEWLVISQAMATNAIAINDGKTISTTTFGRPGNQQDQPVPSGVGWDQGAQGGDGSHDPIGDFMAVVDFMYDVHDIEMASVVLSKRAVRYMARSVNFYPRSGLAAPSGTGIFDINYLLSNFNAEVAKSVVEQATGLNVIMYDAKYNERPLGSQTSTKRRFMDEELALFLPDMASIGPLIGTDLGFGKMLTSPHPMGGMETGFYAWEEEETDPWQTVAGTGVKAFPVFPALETTYTMRLWTP